MLIKIKLIKLYHATVGAEAEGHYWLYKEIFRGTGLIIGPPRSDTCGTCDRIYVQMCSTNNSQTLYQLDLQSILHHSISDAGYESLKNDTLINIQNPNVEVHAFDLEQVLFSPVLTHSDYFYQRKYSSYNFAVTTPKETNKSDYFFWHESVAGRGSEEISSCLLRKIEMEFQPLQPGQYRTHITYSDRCIGQNCNWTLVCLMMVVISRGYFTEWIHKFMSTGHSFLPCDRQFAQIERLKKAARVDVPQDWMRVIREAMEANVVHEMTQQDFLSFDGVKFLFRQPATLKITEVLGIRLTDANPDKIYTRISHEPNTPWDEHAAESRPQIPNLSAANHPSSEVPIPITNFSRKTS